MKEKNLSAVDVMKMMSVSEKYGLPYDCITVSKQGYVVPKTAFLFVGDANGTERFVNPTSPEFAHLFGESVKEWQALRKGVEWILNPYSKYSLSDDIVDAAVSAYSMGLKIHENYAQKINNLRIVLPPNIGFSPSRTTLNKFLTTVVLKPEDEIPKNDSFNYSLWLPGSFVTGTEGGIPLVEDDNLLLETIYDVTAPRKKIELDLVHPDELIPVPEKTDNFKKFLIEIK